MARRSIAPGQQIANPSLRIEVGLWERFDHVAAANGDSRGGMLRAYISSAVERHEAAS